MASYKELFEEQRNLNDVSYNPENKTTSFIRRVFDKKYLKGAGQ